MLHKRTTDGSSFGRAFKHNLDFIKCADWIIDSGREGGDGGGTIGPTGAAEDVAKTKASHTERYLKEML